MQASVRLQTRAMSSFQREQLQDRGLAPGRQVGAEVQRDLGGGPVQALLPRRVLVRLLPPRRLRVRRDALRGGHVQQVHRGAVRQSGM